MRNHKKDLSHLDTVVVHMEMEGAVVLLIEEETVVEAEVVEVDMRREVETHTEEETVEAEAVEAMIVRVVIEEAEDKEEVAVVVVGATEND